MEQRISLRPPSLYVIYHLSHHSDETDDGMTHGSYANADANSAVSALSRETMTRAGLGKSVWAPPNPSLSL